MKRKLGLFLLLPMLVMLFAILASVNVFASDGYTVSFYLDDGESELYDSQTDVSENSYAKIPITPLKNGKVFQYWKIKDGGKFSFATRITEDTVLIAQWENITTYHKVTFMVGDTVVSTQEVEDGMQAIAPANPAVPSGKDFVAWNGDYSSITADTVINAVLEDKEYMIEIIGFDGTVIDDAIRVKHGQSVDMSGFTPPTVPNHSFLEYEGNLANIREDTQIQLIYKPNSYAVTFYSDGVPFGSSASVEWGSSVPFPTTVPSKENYIFIGWYTDDESGEMYTFNEIISGEMSLYARFIPIQKPKFTVTFYTHDGTQYGGVQNVEEGTAAIEPGAPYREGYTFLRWNTDFSAVTSDLKIYPVYSVKKFTVTFIDAEGTLKVFTDVSYGSDIKEIDVGSASVPTGSEFLCWDRSFKEITEDTVISAVYRLKKYVVMFYNSDMQKIGVTQYVEYGKSATIPILATKEGYTFKGWIGADGANPESITDDCIFIASYEKNKYTVSFTEGGNTVNSVEVSYGERVNIYSYDKEGYIFGGWYTDEGLNTRYDFNLDVKQSITLYAKWEEKPEVVFSVIFMVDNNLWNKQDVVENGSVMMPANPTKTGHTFKYWKNLLTGTEASLDAVTADMTLVAEFEINTYTVRFFGVDGSIDEQTVEHGSSATVPTAIPEREGYEFDGWDKSLENISENTDIYPIWRIKSFTVTFFDGSSVISEQTVEYMSFAEMIATPVKIGYTFEKWVDGDGNAFVFGTPITGDTEAYARFKTNKYDIVYYLDGKYHATVSFEYGAELTLLDAPVFDSADRIFLGWSSLPATMPASHLTVTGTTYTYKYYDVIYLINGEEFYRMSVREGDAIPPIDRLPVNLPENIVFIGWGEVPEFMPKADVKVDANIKILNYYKVNYYLDGVLYKTYEVLEGNRIPIEIPPVLDDGYEFVGWGEIPEIMPAGDVNIYGTKAPSLKNAITLEKYSDGELVYVKIAVGQDVEFASILASVTVGTEFELVYSNTANDMGEFNIDENGTLKFVWAYGENTTEDIVLLELVLSPIDKIDLNRIGTLTVEDMLVFDADGNILSADYTIVSQ